MAESFILFFFNDKILFAKPIVPKLRTVPSICVKSIHNPDNLYLSHPNSQLLCGRVRGDHPTYKIRTSFLMPLAFSVSIFNKKISSDTSCGNFQTLTKFWKIPQLTYAQWDFLLKIVTLRVKGIRKNALILYVAGN